LASKSPNIRAFDFKAWTVRGGAQLAASSPAIFSRADVEAILASENNFPPE